MSLKPDRKEQAMFVRSVTVTKVKEYPPGDIRDGGRVGELLVDLGDILIRGHYISIGKGEVIMDLPIRGWLNKLDVKVHIHHAVRSAILRATQKSWKLGGSVTETVKPSGGWRR